MQIVFQDPFASLNRRRTVEQSIEFPLRVHQPELRGAAQRRERVRELLDLVGLRASHAAAYPRELSGGQCQRVSIARALAIGPEFVVLDEAVSAVDVSIQAQILNLLRESAGQLGLTYLFVSHDLSVVRYMSNTIGVMYRGRIVELGPREQLFSSPRHPCTHALLASIPGAGAEPRRCAGEHADRPRRGDRGRRGRRLPLPPALPARRARALPGGGAAARPASAPEHCAACHFPQSAESLAAEAGVAATP